MPLTAHTRTGPMHTSRNPNLMNERTNQTLLVTLVSGVLVLVLSSVALIETERATPDRGSPRVERIVDLQLETL